MASFDDGTTKVPARAVPTLTEVVDLAHTRTPTPIEDAAAPPRQHPPALPSEDELARRVLADVQLQIDMMFEYRLRECLTPALARMADGLMRELRNDLATTVRDMVAQAVAHELTRLRKR